MRLSAAKPIERGVLQNSLEEHGQLGGGLVGVVHRQLDHAVLHNIECRVFVSDMIDRALKSAFFHRFEEIGKFLLGGQNEKLKSGCIFLTRRRLLRCLAAHYRIPKRGSLAKDGV